MKMFIYVYTSFTCCGHASSLVGVRAKEEVENIFEEEGIDISEEARKFLEGLAAKARLKKYVEKWCRVLEEAWYRDALLEGVVTLDLGMKWPAFYGRVSPRTKSA